MTTVSVPRAQQCRITGSTDEVFTFRLLRRVAGTIWVLRNGEGEPEQDRQDELHAAMTALAAFKPRDEVEAMLAAQAVAMHQATMELARRAMISDQPHEVAEAFRRTSVKTNRAFIDVTDALARKRGEHRRQVVRVERVTVEAGAQAVVGVVASGPGGGGYGGKAEAEPRGQAAGLAHDAPLGPELPPLRGQEPGREAMPVPGNARKGSLPATRRRQHRPANG